MDEAHKLLATVSGGVVRATRRFQLGRLLSNVTRHYLLLTATPHNGKEVDFQLFLSLVDIRTALAALLAQAPRPSMSRISCAGL